MLDRIWAPTPRNPMADAKVPRAATLPHGVATPATGKKWLCGWYVLISRTTFSGWGKRNQHNITGGPFLWLRSEFWNSRKFRISGHWKWHLSSLQGWSRPHGERFPTFVKQRFAFSKIELPHPICVPGRIVASPGDEWDEIWWNALAIAKNSASNPSSNIAQLHSVLAVYRHDSNFLG